MGKLHTSLPNSEVVHVAHFIVEIRRQCNLCKWCPRNALLIYFKSNITFAISNLSAMSIVSQRALGSQGLVASAQGLGCMVRRNLCESWPENAISIIPHSSFCCREWLCPILKKRSLWKPSPLRLAWVSIFSTQLGFTRYWGHQFLSPTNYAPEVPLFFPRPLAKMVVCIPTRS